MLPGSSTKRSTSPPPSAPSLSGEPAPADPVLRAEVERLLHATASAGRRLPRTRRRGRRGPAALVGRPAGPGGGNTVWCLRGDRTAGARRDGHRLPGAGPEARSPRRGQGPPPRGLRRSRPGVVSPRDRHRRRAAAPAHPAAARLGRRRRPALLRHAVRRGRVAPRRDCTREAHSRSTTRVAHRAARLPARSTTRIARASCTATSSPRTSSCSDGQAVVADFGIAPRDRDRCGEAGITRDTACRARHAGVHEPRAGRGRHDRRRPRPTCTLWAACCTRCSKVLRRLPPRRSRLSWPVTPPTRRRRCAVGRRWDRRRWSK